MAEQSSPSSAKAQVLNDRTYQEVEYLKKNLGPILVAALAEICIRRPADPIEYLGHWLLRWRYNEELKRRDVQNALEVVRQKAWTKDDESLQPNPNAPSQAPGPETFTQGFVPGSAYAPPGYGGPLDQNVVEEAMKPEGAEGERVEGQRSNEGAEGVSSGERQQPAEGVEGRSSGEGQAEARKSGGGAGEATSRKSGEGQQASNNEIGADGQQQSKTSAERRGSQLEGQEKRGSGQEQSASGEKISKVGSGEKQSNADEASRASRRSVDQAEKRGSGQADLNNSEAPPNATASNADQGEEEETPE